MEQSQFLESLILVQLLINSIWGYIIFLSRQYPQLQNEAYSAGLSYLLRLPEEAMK